MKRIALQPYLLKLHLFSLGQKAAVQKVLADGLRTADIYSEGTTKVSTTEMGDAVVAALGTRLPMTLRQLLSGVVMACCGTLAAAVPCPDGNEIEGDAVAILRVQVDTDGNPSQVKLKHSSGCAYWDKAALRAVRKWKFKPGTANGIAQPMWATVPVRFQAQKSSAPERADAAQP